MPNTMVNPWSWRDHVNYKLLHMIYIAFFQHQTHFWHNSALLCFFSLFFFFFSSFLRWNASVPLFLVKLKVEQTAVPKLLHILGISRHYINRWRNTMRTFISVVGATINCLVIGQTGSWQHFGSHKKMAMRLVNSFAFKGKDG